MLSIQFTDHASEDLDKLITYTLEHWGAEQASAYLDGLEALIEKLAAHPKMGTPSDCLSQNILAFPYQSHTIYYECDDQLLTVVRLLHSSMNPSIHIHS